MYIETYVRNHVMPECYFPYFGNTVIGFRVSRQLQGCQATPDVLGGNGAAKGVVTELTLPVDYKTVIEYTKPEVAGYENCNLLRKTVYSENSHTMLSNSGGTHSINTQLH